MNPVTHSTFSRRRAFGRAAAGLLAVAVGATLAGCGTGPKPATKLDPEADVTITWWTGQADQAQTILKGLAEEFEEEHSNVTIEMSSGAPSTEDLLQKLSSSFAGGTYPDISYSFGSWASELAGSGRTLDITDKVADDADLGWDEFSGAARATAQPEGGATIGFPAVVDNISLIYNKTVFDAAGVEYPTDDWTWDDFRAAAAEMTDPATKTYGYGYSVSGSEETTWQFWPHLWQRGGEILDGDTATFDSAEGVEALTFLKEMAVDDKSVYLDQTDTKFGQFFASDQIGMITSGPWMLYDLKTAGTKYGVAPLPGIDGDHTTISGADIWVMFDHQDPNREYWSYEFMKWLTAAEQDVRWNVAYGNLPLRESEVESPEFQKQVDDMPGIEIMAANSANATIPRPTVPGYVKLSESIGDAISRVLQGQAEPEPALQDAADRATEALGEQ
ncbi:ABC transporter substrate-binding protein [Microbacterium sp. NPDC058342]|uniref:ABC transporter substrate-binding protein n=1 Tax=Microbacterium sp. NPDC058342 TaxID=3346454 RepID=UPI00365CE7DD